MAAAFQRRLTKASLYIRRLLHLPAMIGVQEVENLATLQALATTLNRDAREAREFKPRYEAYLEEGNDPGGIDIGFLVDRARVDVLQVAQEGKGICAKYSCLACGPTRVPSWGTPAWVTPFMARRCFLR